MNPISDALTSPWWAHLAGGEFALPRCSDCAGWHFQPRPVCPHCGSQAIAWQAASGRGRVHSFTVVHRAPSPAFATQVPYAIVIVATNEGPHLMSRLVGADPAAVRIGDRVRVRLDRLSEDGPVLALFEPDPDQ
jgi:uncharacterized OB-fold protein